MDGSRFKNPALFAVILLIASTWFAFRQVPKNDFISYDDPQYVTDNPHVLSGLTPANIRWAFTTGHASNWHPLTWISHMLDVQIFGLKAAGHHAVNLVLHVSTTLLLFAFLVHSTQLRVESVCVATLFAVHPLHVESVAWVSERKDVLSAFFGMLTLYFYAGYALRSKPEAMKAEAGPVKDGGARRWHYALALAMFILGLMSKPMLVTLPFALLLFDFWPFQRFELWNGPMVSQASSRLIAEKIPFFGAAALSSVITFLVQSGGHAVISTTGLPLTLRAGNVIVSYVRYLAKLFWPEHLAVFYPYPRPYWPAWEIAAAGLSLIAISIVCLIFIRRKPWLIVGWLFYLGTLVPVIGFVQIGAQSMADRYAYIPSIGIFIAVVWTIGGMLKSLPVGRTVLALIAPAAVVACIVVTQRQVSYWQNGEALFQHALAVTRNNVVALSGLGSALARQQKMDQAADYFRAAIRIDPEYPEAHFHLGLTLQERGGGTLALEQFSIAARLEPWNARARTHWAAMLEKTGDREAALTQYREATRLDPENAQAQYGLGVALARTGDLPEAEEHLQRAIALNPDNAEAQAQLADVETKLGKSQQAEQILHSLAIRYPTNFDVHINLGSLLWQRGLRSDAISEFQVASRINPDHPMAHYDLGISALNMGQTTNAVLELRKAISLKPDYLEARVGLGRALAATGAFNESVQEWQAAAGLNPTNANLQLNLANAQMLAQRTNEALASFRRALDADPSLADKTLQQARELAAAGQATAALARFRMALWLRPGDPDAQQGLAWALATHPRPEIRNPQEAITLALAAIKTTGGTQARFWASLDAAYADAGQFEEAIAAAEKTKATALQANDLKAAEGADQRLSLYQNRQCFRQ